jgi:hypothetical protein
MSLTVPFRVHTEPRPSGDVPAGEPPARGRSGALDLRSAAVYLAVWAGVVFVVEMLLLWSSHAALDRLGVLSSASRAAATVLDVDVPASGVLPALEFGALLPWLLLGAAASALLWLLTCLAVVLVHNGICAVTGGPRLRVR